MIELLELSPAIHTSVTVDSQVFVLPTAQGFLAQCPADTHLRKSTLCFVDLTCSFAAGEVFSLAVVWLAWDNTAEMVGIDQATHGVFSHSWCI